MHTTEVQTIVEQALAERYQMLDALIAAYLRETGAKVSEIQLVEEQASVMDDGVVGGARMRTTWRVEKR